RSGSGLLQGRGRYDIGFLSCGLDQRQIDAENRALSDGTLYADVTPTLLDDAVDGRKAQPGTFPRLLSGEERLKNVRARLRVHPIAGIAHCQHDIVARPEIHVLTGVLFIK